MKKFLVVYYEWGHDYKFPSAKITTDKDVNILVDGEDKFTGRYSKDQKTPGAPGTTICKRKLKAPTYIYKCRSFVGHIMWYNTKVVPDVANVARELAIHMIHTGTEHGKALGPLIGYLKGEETKFITVRKPKVPKAVMLFDSNYATNKETRKSVSGLVSKLGGTIIMCYLKTQGMITISSTEAEYVSLLACAQEMKSVNMLLQEISGAQKPATIHEDKQGAIFLANNRQVGMNTKHINIHHHLLRYMLEEKYIEIKNIRSE